jgi:hypothetical protein
MSHDGFMTTEDLPARSFPSWIPWVTGLAAFLLTVLAGGALALLLRYAPVEKL